MRQERRKRQGSKRGRLMQFSFPLIFVPFESNVTFSVLFQQVSAYMHVKDIAP